MTTKNRATLTTDLQTAFPDNGSGLITPSVLRDQQTDIIDSFAALLDDRVSVIVVAVGSHAADQGPTATDTSHQVLFGAGGTITGDMTINADGSVTCGTTGSYLFFTNLTYGRSSGVSFAEIFIRILIDGAQVGGSGINRFNNADTRLTKSVTFTQNLTAGDVFTMEIVRDSTGDDDGGLFVSNPTAAGWEDVPSSSIAIYKLGFSV